MIEAADVRRYEFTPTLDELAEAAHLVGGRKPGQAVPGLILAAVLGLGFIYVEARYAPLDAADRGRPVPRWIDLALPSCLVAAAGLFVYYMERVEPRRAARRNPMLASVVVVELSADGAALLVGPTRVERRWRTFDWLTETRRQFLIGMAGQPAEVLLPKRTIDGDAERDAVRQLLTTQARRTNPVEYGFTIRIGR